MLALPLRDVRRFQCPRTSFFVTFSIHLKFESILHVFTFRTVREDKIVLLVGGKGRGGDGRGGKGRGGEEREDCVLATRVVL